MQIIFTECGEIHPFVCRFQYPGIMGNIALIPIGPLDVSSDYVNTICLPPPDYDFAGSPDCWITGILNFCLAFFILINCHLSQKVQNNDGLLDEYFICSGFSFNNNIYYFC